MAPSPKSVLRILLAIALLLTLVGVVFQSLHMTTLDYPADELLPYMTNIDREHVIGSWYSASLMLFAAFLLGIIALAVKNAGAAYLNHWRVLAAIFTFLSLDETVGIHEATIEVLRNALNTGGFLYYSWIVPATGLLVIFVLAYRRFLSHLPASMRRLLIIAGVVYVAGAVGMEAVGGWYASANGDSSLPYYLITSVEEPLEMSGLVLLVYVLLVYIRTHVDLNMRLRRQDLPEHPSGQRSAAR